MHIVVKTLYTYANIRKIYEVTANVVPWGRRIEGHASVAWFWKVGLRSIDSLRLVVLSQNSAKILLHVCAVFSTLFDS